MTTAIKVVADQVGMGYQTLRKAVCQTEVDTGQREGVTSAEQEENKRLEAENRR